MKTQILKRVYEGNEIEFEFSGRKDVMVNATEMAKSHGKRVDVFLKSDHAKNFIKVLELTPYGGSSVPLKKEEIIKTVNGVSTWMHKILALKFAAWLSPVFEVWVYTTIDTILSEYGRQLETSIHNTVKLRKELSRLETKLANENEDFARYLEIMHMIKKEKSVRAQATKNKFQYEIIFQQD